MCPRRPGESRVVSGEARGPGRYGNETLPAFPLECSIASYTQYPVSRLGRVRGPRFELTHIVPPGQGPPTLMRREEASDGGVEPVSSRSPAPEESRWIKERTGDSTCEPLFR